MRGMGDAIGKVIIFAMIVAGLLGWILIEFLLWLFSFITISLN